MIEYAFAATDLIHTFAHAMDRKRFDEATSVFRDPVAIDYSAVGGPKADMRPTEVKVFLSGLLGRADLSVHTMIGQVIPSIGESGATAYYAVRHFRHEDGEQKQFSVFGWYVIAVEDGRISGLTIKVQGTEGDAAILG